MDDLALGDLGVYRDAFLCGVHDWMEFWGDPWLSGTILMLGYLAAGLKVVAAARRTGGRERFYWRLCGWVMLFQVVNTHADLHGLVYTTGRCLAHLQGWYDRRREFQAIMLLVLAGVVAAILLVILVVFLRSILGNLLLTLGVAASIGITAIKAINLHGFDTVFDVPVGPFIVSDFIEFAGLVLAYVAAAIGPAGARRRV